MNRSTTIISILLLVMLLLAGVWWYFFFEKGAIATQPQPVSSSTPKGFTPLNNAPINASTSSPRGATSSDTSNIPDELPSAKKKVMRLYATPVAYGLLASSTASSSSVFFVDRGTGHIYNASKDGSLTEKISNTTILRVYESYFDVQAKNILLRYIKEGTDAVTTVIAPITSEIRAKFLSNNIDTLASSPKGDKIFYIEKTNDGTVGYISKIDGSAKKGVFESPLKEWVVSWPEENIVTLTTKASRLSPGFLYFLNLKTGNLVKILGPVYGLTTNTSKDGKKVLYSRSTSGKIETRVLTVAENALQDTLFLTLPEKCVWSTLVKTSAYCAVPQTPPSNLPDDWYKGLTKTADTIWHVDTVTNSVHKITNLYEDAGTQIDAVNLTLSPDEQSLYFINNTDLSLWSVDLAD